MKEETILKIIERYCQFRINGCKYDIECGWGKSHVNGMIEAYKEIQRKLNCKDTRYFQNDITKHKKYWSDKEWDECCRLVFQKDENIDYDKVITIGEVRKIFNHMYKNLPDNNEELFKTVKKMSKEIDEEKP